MVKRAPTSGGIESFHFRSALTILNGRLFILAHDWDNMSEDAKREAATAAFEQSQLLVTLYNALAEDKDAGEA